MREITHAPAMDPLIKLRDSSRNLPRDIKKQMDEVIKTISELMDLLGRKTPAWNKGKHSKQGKHSNT